MIRMFIRTMTTAPSAKRIPLAIFGLEGRYVTALYNAASQMNQLDQVEKGLRDLQVVLNRPKVVDFMETSLISRTAKANLLKAVGSEVGMPAAATNFLAVVAENGRLKELGQMIKMFLAVMVAHRNEALCEVITADPLDDATRTALVNILKRFVTKGKTIQLKEIVAKDAIGGVVIGFEDKHIDMTIYKRITLYRGRLKYYIKYQ